MSKFSFFTALGSTARLPYELGQSFIDKWRNPPNYMTAPKPPRQDPAINGHVLIVENPYAGNGRGATYAGELFHHISDASGLHGVGFNGKVKTIPALQDPTERVQAISAAITELRNEGSARNVYVVASGGNGTANEVIQAVGDAMKGVKEREERMRVMAIPGPAGRANDLQMAYGVPRLAKDMPMFLAMARGIEVMGMRIYYDTDPNPQYAFLSASWGVSGDLIHKLEKLNRRGDVTLWDYVKLVPETAARSRTMYVSVGKKEPIQVGEVFAMANHRLGRVASMPMPMEGARIFLPLKYPYGLYSLTEVFARGALLNMGFQQIIDPPSRMRTFPVGREIDVFPGERASLKFFDEWARPVWVHGTLNGEYMAGCHQATIVPMFADEAPFVLAGERSEMMVRQEFAEPMLPFDAATHGLVSGIVSMPGTVANTSRLLYELFREMGTREDFRF